MSKNNQHDLLDNLKIAAPCNVSWESMDGNERVRHCSQCTKNVYNISAMTRSEANQFLQATAHQACVNFYQRHDGTIITDNCPVGLRKLRAQYRKVASVVGTVVSLMQGLFLNAFAGEPETSGSNIQGQAQINPQPNHLRGRLVPVATGGKPVAQPVRLGGEAVPLGGSPVPQLSAETNAMNASINAYREKIKFVLSRSMPNEDLGHAAVSFNVSSQGNIDNIKLINPSPGKTTDEHIIKAISKVKLSALPKDFKAPILYMYYECRPARNIDLPSP